MNALEHTGMRIAAPKWLLTEGPTETRTAVWLFVVALVLRIGFVLLYPQYPFGLADDRGYDELGWSLASGTGFSLPSDSGRYPAVGVGPLYPFLLGLLYLVFGHDLTAVRLLQAVVSAAVVLLTWQMTRAAGYSSKIALLSAAFVASYPAFIIYTGVVMTEVLFTFLLVASIWAFLCALENRSSWTWILAGALMGATILHRSEVLVLVPMCAGVAVYRCTRDTLAGVVFFLAAAGLVVAPWTVRNYVTFDEIVPVSANGGRTLWIATKPWDEWVPDDPELQALITGLDQIEIDQALGRAAVQDIIAAPVQYLELCLKRVPQFWIGSHTTYLVGFSESFRTYFANGAYGRLLTKIALLLANLGLILFAVAGVWQTSRATWRKPAALLLVPILGVSAVHVLLFATSRFHVPVMPFVLVFAAVQLAPYLDTGFWTRALGQRS